MKNWFAYKQLQNCAIQYFSIDYSVCFAYFAFIILRIARWSRYRERRLIFPCVKDFHCSTLLNCAIWLSSHVFRRSEPKSISIVARTFKFTCIHWNAKFSADFILVSTNDNNKNVLLLFNCLYALASCSSANQMRFVSVLPTVKYGFFAYILLVVTSNICLCISSVDFTGHFTCCMAAPYTRKSKYNSIHGNYL